VPFPGFPERYGLYAGLVSLAIVAVWLVWSERRRRSAQL